MKSRILALACLMGVAAVSLQAEEQRTRAPGRVADAPKIDLNTATEKTLAALPYLGPDLARAIVAARPFINLNDLNRVPGFTTEQLEQVRLHLTVTPPPEKKPLGEPRRADSAAPTKRPAQTEKINLNTAGLTELEVVPAIGPDLARQIVAARPFRSLNDLDRLKGLSAERLELIKTQVTIGAP